MAAREYTLKFEIRRARMFPLRSAMVAILLRLITWIMGTTRLVQMRPPSAEAKARLEASLSKARYRGAVVDSEGSGLSSTTPASTPDSSQVALRSVLAELREKIEEVRVADRELRTMAEQIRAQAIPGRDGSGLAPPTPASTPGSAPGALRQGDDGIDWHNPDVMRAGMKAHALGYEQGRREAEAGDGCRDCGATDVHLHQLEGRPLCWGCFDHQIDAKIAEDAGRIAAESVPPAPTIEIMTVDQHLDEWFGKKSEPSYEPRLDPRNCYDCGRPLGATVVRGRYTQRPYHPACIKAERETINAPVLG